MEDETSGQRLHHRLHRVDGQEDVSAPPPSQRQQHKVGGGWECVCVGGGGGRREEGDRGAETRESKAFRTLSN